MRKILHSLSEKIIIQCWISLSYFLTTEKGKICKKKWKSHALKFLTFNVTLNTLFFHSSPNFKLISDEKLDDRFDWVAEPENKLTTVEFQKNLKYIHSIQYRRGVSSLLFLKQSAGTYFGAYVFDHFNPFYGPINKMMSDLAAGGIYEYWDKYFDNPNGHKFKIDEIGPQVLKIEHLLIGFKICLVLLLISAIALVLEILFKNCQSFTSKIKSCLKRKSCKSLKPKQYEFWSHRALMQRRIQNK